MALSGHRAGIFADQKVKIGAAIRLNDVINVKLGIAAIIPRWVGDPFGASRRQFGVSTAV